MSTANFQSSEFISPSDASALVNAPAPPRLSPAAYRHLAEFRFRLRSFLSFSAELVDSTVIEPQQHQLMLALKGLPEGARPTVKTIADRLCLKHNSTVELINRLEKRGAVKRVPSDRDRREVLIQLTPSGEDLLEKLCVLHWQELQALAPTLIRALQAILDSSPENLQAHGQQEGFKAAESTADQCPDYDLSADSMKC